MKNSMKRFIRHLIAPLQRVAAINQHFWLYNRHQSTCLTKRRVPSQTVSIRFNTSPTRNTLTNRNYRAPLSKPCAHLVILSNTLSQTIKTFSHFFTRVTSKLFSASIYLNTRQHARFCNDLQQRNARLC